MHGKYPIHIHMVQKIFHAQIVHILHPSVQHHEGHVDMPVFDPVQFPFISISVELAGKLLLPGIPPVKISGMVNGLTAGLHQKGHSRVVGAEGLYFHVVHLILAHRRHKLYGGFDLGIDPVSHQIISSQADIL